MCSSRPAQGPSSSWTGSRPWACARTLGFVPHFEDWHFAVRYLLELAEPRIGIVCDALYVYRKRADGTASLQLGVRHLGRYGDVLEFGYLDALQRAARAGGRPAEWVQQLIVYELSWYLSEDEKAGSGVYLAPERLERFHDLLGRVMALLDPEVVARHGVRPLRAVWIDVLAHAGRPQAWHNPFVVRTRSDWVMGMQRLNYRFVGDPPQERFTDDGRVIEPAFAKTMAHRWYGRALLYERIVWLPAGGGVQVSIDGTTPLIVERWPLNPAGKGRRNVRLRLWLIRRNPGAHLVHAIIHRLPVRLGGRLLRRGASALTQWAARTPWVRRRFGGAWVLMDRVHDAGDNGERLFEYLRSERPDVNAWFVIERDTPDWERLRRAWGDRLVGHGSLAWKLLMLNGAWLLSSHADMAILYPPKLAGLRRPREMKVAFLQHGITKDDLSLWLNQRELDFVAVGTAAELQSMTADGTPYRVTAKEARNTGLPRFDRLLAEGRRQPELRDLIIVAPTWRNDLAVPLRRGSQRRSVNEAFWESDYVQNWGAFLRSPVIAAAAGRGGLRVGFMPHPNFQPVLSQFNLPAHVEALTFAGTDVQALYARCALLVTDYSSVAFDLACLDRPVIYFQFDQETMFAGSHVWRRGYFDYARDGFGPVVADLSAAEQAVVAAIEQGRRRAARYRARVGATFPARDGQASARVVAAIEELSRPYEGPPG